MALDPCVYRTLIALSAATLQALLAFVQTQKDFINLRIFKLNVQKIKQDYMQLKQESIQMLLDAAQAPITEALSFYPTNVASIVNECAQVGTFLTAPQAVFSSLREYTDTQLYRGQRYETVGEETVDEIDRLSRIEVLLDEMAVLMTQVIQEKLAPPATP